MAIVVGFISEKGGVGKTTACYHIAYALAAYHAKRVLVIDADYQRGGLTGRLFPELIEGFSDGVAPGVTLYHKFQQLYSAAPQTPEVDIYEWRGWNACLHVIAADPRLATVSKDKLPASSNILSNNQALLQHMRTLDFVLQPLKGGYDYILIDSHPEVSDIMRSIIYCADYCVSPVKLDRQSSIGVATVVGEINNVNRDIDLVRRMIGINDLYRETVFAGAIGMMAREYGGILKETERTEYSRLRHSGGIFENYVTEGDGIRQAAALRAPVYVVNGQNAQRQSDQFRAMAIEFMRVCS